MDISDTLAPKSDQLDAIDLIAGARTFTVKGVRRGNAEQPVQIDLDEFDRPWRPSKGMRRVLAAVWGADASKYAGHRVRLFCDETVKFGGKHAPGIRIEAIDGIREPQSVTLLTARGQYAMHVVQPLEPGAARDWLAELAETDGDADLIGALGMAATRAGAPVDIVSAIRDAYRAVTA